MFNDKKFVSGYQPLVTMQALNKSKKRGWFIRNSELGNCDWTATEDDFEKGSVIFDYEQTFGMPPKTTKEKGLNFQAPRVQILLRSPLMVEETSGMKRVIGTFDDENVKEIFDNDKVASDLASSKGEMRKRGYIVRTKYLVYVLTKENKRAHKIPIVLTIKGLNGTDLNEKLKMYEKEMSKCLSKALDTEVPMQYNEQFYATTVFCPQLSNEERGTNNIEICAVESFDIPEYQNQDAAIESLDRLSIPDDDRESTWHLQEMYTDYINQHAKQTASRLDGTYGIKEGVEILPQSRTVPVEVVDEGPVKLMASATKDSLGADSHF